MTRIKSHIDFEIIWKKIHGSLTHDENLLFESWLTEDHRHMDYFREAERFYREGSSLNKIPADPEMSWRSLLNRIKKSRQERIRKRIIYMGAVAASAFIILAFLLMIPQGRQAEIVSVPQEIEPGTDKAMLILDDGSVYDLSREKELSIQTEGATITSRGTSIEYIREESPTPVLKYNTLSVPRGGEFFLTLSDGTKVWLNSSTTLRYPVQFSSAERKAELNGEAYFEVARDDKKPFRIITGEQVLEVLGTSFNISSYNEDEDISTTLLSGKVQLSLQSDPSVSQVLMPSYQGVFNKNNRSFSSERVDVDQYTAWKEGWFRFEDQNLSEMMVTLSRWYDVDVKFENQDAENIKFTGSIRRYDHLEEILKIIERTKEVKFTIREKEIIIN